MLFTVYNEKVFLKIFNRIKRSLNKNSLNKNDVETLHVNVLSIEKCETILFANVIWI